MAKSRTSLEKSEYIVSGIKIGLSLLGPVGTLFEESIEIRDRVRGKRATQFIEALASYINTLPGGLIDYNDTQKEQFAEIFECIFDSVVRSSSEDRRDRLKNILCNSLNTGDASVDDIRRFVSFTNRISEIQVRMLGLYNNDNERKENQHKLGELWSKLDGIKIKKSSTTRRVKKHGELTESLGIEAELILAQKEYDKMKSFVDSVPNPDSPELYGLDKADFLSEVQELISIGLLHDLHTLGKDGLPNRHFVISRFGKRYIKYIMG